MGLERFGDLVRPRGDPRLVEALDGEGAVFAAGAPSLATAATTSVTAPVRLPAGVNPVSDASFEDEVLRSSRPVVVLFYAPWCPHCQRLKPIYKEFADGYSGGNVKFAALNIDENPMMSARYGIESIPTIKVFDRGEVVKTVRGGLDGAALGADPSEPPSPGFNKKAIYSNPSSKSARNCRKSNVKSNAYRTVRGSTHKLNSAISGTWSEM